MIKKLATFVAVSCCFTSIASAVSLEFERFQADDTGLTNKGFVISGAYDGLDYVYTFTAKGKDFDGVGGQNDSFSFDLRHQAFKDSTVQASGLGTSSVSLGMPSRAGVGAQMFGTDGRLNVNQSFRLSVENMVVQSDLPTQAIFNGFTSIEIRSGAEKTYVFGEGTGLDSYSTLSFEHTFSGLSELIVSTKTNGTRFTDLGGSFTVVKIPEARACALILSLIGLVAFVARRR